MDEYIKREALYGKAYWHGEHPDVSNPFPDGVDAIDIEDVDAIPAADVAPVRHGRWESVKNPQWPAYSHDKCSLCGWWNTKNALCYDGRKKPGHALNYCPNCGAKMDGERKDEGADDEP